MKNDFYLAIGHYLAFEEKEQHQINDAIEMAKESIRVTEERIRTLQQLQLASANRTANLLRIKDTLKETK